MWCSFTSWQLAQRLFYVSNVMKVYFCLTTGRGHAVPQKTLFRRELLSRNLCNTLKLPFCLCFVTNTYTLSLQRWHQITPHHGDSVWCNSAYSLLMKRFWMYFKAVYRLHEEQGSYKRHLVIKEYNNHMGRMIASDSSPGLIRRQSIAALVLHTHSETLLSSCHSTMERP